MKLKILLQVFFMSCFYAQTFADINSDIHDQAGKSTQFLLYNLYRSDVASGAVIAAPSTVHPNYFYHWVRDAAITSNVVMDLEAQNPILKAWLLNHVDFLTISTASAVQIGEGLGEPKFMVDGSVFTGPWGRPQDDGPALRATAMIRLYKLAQSQNWPEFGSLKDRLYKVEMPPTSLVKSDLEYVAHHWSENCFDLWEETIGYHFYTLMAARRAMRLGSDFAQSLGDTGAAQFYDDQFRLISQDLLRFWDEGDGYIPATLPSHGMSTELPGGFPHASSKSGKDTAVLLGLVHSSLYDGFLNFSSDHALATYQTLRDSFSGLYGINSIANIGPAFGRYPEDTYDGYTTESVGNPWVLTTLAGAELLYRAAAELFNASSPVVVSSLNIKIFERALANGTLTVNQSLAPKSDQLLAIAKGLFNEADLLMANVLFHRNADGSLSEQINRDTGYMQGAPNLSWSHSAFITASEARDQVSQFMNSSK